MSKCSIYIRKSSEEKLKDLSIENQFIAILAQYERKMHSERIKRGLLVKKLADKKKTGV